jgi:hypothetical protein
VTCCVDKGPTLCSVHGEDEKYMQNNEPLGSIKDWEFLDWLSVLLASQEGLCSLELISQYVVSIHSRLSPSLVESIFCCVVCNCVTAFKNKDLYWQKLCSSTRHVLSL